ncbi:MAG: MBL fold metallo-hydrolase [Syntrophomonadaceae bacterium]
MKCTNYQDISVGQSRRAILGSAIKVFLYVVDGLVIDTGPSCLRKEIRPFFGAHAIEQVALTHVHEDHSGMAAWLQEQYNVPIYLHRDSLSYAGQSGKYPLYRHIFWGSRRPFHGEALPQQISTAKYEFDVIDAPGHCAAHNVFHEKNQGWLFTGDLYLGPQQVVAIVEENMAQTITTLEKLVRLDFQTLFCAHSGVRENGRKLLQDKLDYLRELQEKVNDLKKQGLNDRQIDRRLFPQKSPITYVSGGEWSSLNLVRTF